MLPSLWTCTRMTSPQWPPFMLLGRVGHPSTRRYGLGSSVGLGYRVCWAWALTCAGAPNVAIAIAPATRINPARLARDIVTLQLEDQDSMFCDWTLGEERSQNRK